ncbi:MAG: hypothetical protein IKD70_04875 [Eggerthellaceae bacterium]|nr:hypothetical protein [Eggerthellaceae bacterium]
MRKFNANSIVALFAIVFILLGLGGTCIKRLGFASLELVSALGQGDTAAVLEYRSAVDDITGKGLSYHKMLMDIDSARNNLLGTRVIVKDDSTVIKAVSGKLMEQVERVDDEDIEDAVARIRELQAVAEAHGAGFLYCAAPKKELYEEAPGNAVNAFKDNYERFVMALRSAGIPLLDCSLVLEEPPLRPEDAFFVTDHHWKPTVGFDVAGSICERLASLYGFSYDERLTDLSNYTVTTYPNWFLGSLGKKTGTYFTWQGADDFDLITPDFETAFIEEQPLKGEVLQGPFEKTVLDMSNMEKDHYGLIPYATYCGGDFRLQIFTNTLNPDGKKILLVRDSYASVVAPFLALQAGELHICDVRDFEYFYGDKLDIGAYIAQIEPDYVIVLYSGVSGKDTAHGKYDFF